MKQQWASLAEILRKKVRNNWKYENFVRIFINYFPDLDSVTTTKVFNPEETGISSFEQRLSSRTHYYHPVLYREKAYLVSEFPIISDLILFGKVGYDNGIKLFEDAAKSLFGNKKLNTEGVAITKEFYEALPQTIRQMEKFRNFWLATRFDSKNTHGFWQVKAALTKAVLYDDLKDNPKFYRKQASIIPVISVPDNFQIDIGNKVYDGSTPFRAFKTQLAPDKHH